MYQLSNKMLLFSEFDSYSQTSTELWILPSSSSLSFMPFQALFRMSAPSFIHFFQYLLSSCFYHFLIFSSCLLGTCNGLIVSSSTLETALNILNMSINQKDTKFCYIYDRNIDRDLNVSLIKEKIKKTLVTQLLDNEHVQELKRIWLLDFV